MWDRGPEQSVEWLGRVLSGYLLVCGEMWCFLYDRYGCGNWLQKDLHTFTKCLKRILGLFFQESGERRSSPAVITTWQRLDLK